MFVVNLSLTEMIAYILLLILAGITMLGFIVEWVLDFFKKDCYKCKHYKLDSVAGYGDVCWYKCDLKEKKDKGTSMNTCHKLCWCKNFEKKEKEDE